MKKLGKECDPEFGPQIQHGEDLYELFVKAGVFEMLEGAGQIMLCEAARIQIAIFIASYQSTADWHSWGLKAALQRYRKAAKELEAMAATIDALNRELRTLGDPDAAQLPTMLRA